jgi:hypothetical protein
MMCEIHTAESYSRGLEIGEQKSYEVSNPDMYVNFDKYDIYHVEVTVTSGGPIDVYLVTHSEFAKFDENRSFKAVVKKEGITETKFDYENPEKDERYILIIDNSDNGRSGDTLPTSSIYYEVETSIEERNQEVTIRNIFIIAGIIAVAIILIVIRVIKKIRRR